MKLIELASLALAAAGIFGVYNAGAAIIGTTTNSTALNITLTITTNTPEKVSSNSTSITYTSSIKTVKINNKILLTLFQNWASAGTNSSTFNVAGAKIVIGWDNQWDGDVLVVDKTGTNVLYDVTTGSEDADGDTAYFCVDFQNQYGASSGKETDSASGTDKYIAYNTGKYTIYDDYLCFLTPKLRALVPQR